MKRRLPLLAYPPPPGEGKKRAPSFNAQTPDELQFIKCDCLRGTPEALLFPALVHMQGAAWCLYQGSKLTKCNAMSHIAQAAPDSRAIPALALP
jgi:hypothetical protein